MRGAGGWRENTTKNQLVLLSRGRKDEENGNNSLILQGSYFFVQKFEMTFLHHRTHFSGISVPTISNLYFMLATSSVCPPSFPVICFDLDVGSPGSPSPRLPERKNKISDSISFTNFTHRAGTLLCSASM